MLANIEPTHNDFAALAAYLIHGRERPTSPDRVAWVMGHNLSTDDPVRAAAIMAFFAERSARCRKACYHVSINWHPEEQPTPEIMQEIACKTLEMAGLGEHQALVMGHGDKPHRHLHMMINRVHPDTGRAWSTSHDYRRFDAIMKQLADTYGFKHVPPHSFHPEDTHDHMKAPNSNATFAAKRGAPTSRPQWSRASANVYSGRISELLDHGSTWDDIETLFAEDGFTLEAKGQGWVVGNAQSYVKLSALALMMTANGLAKRRPPAIKRRKRPAAPTNRSKLKRFQRNIWTVDAVDIARAIGTKDQIRAAVQEARGQRKTRLAKAPLMKQLMEELKEQMKASTSLSPSRPRRPSTRRATRKREPRHTRSDR